MSKQCSYQKDGFQCKNWISSQDDEIVLCPIHAGILPERTIETAFQARFEHHADLCSQMDDGQLRNHVFQLEALLEDVKLRQQAANHVRNKRLRQAIASGELTEEQLADMHRARSARPDRAARIGAGELKAPISKEEKEILNLMKKGISREKAMRLLEME